MTDRPSNDERLMAILLEARSAPLPSATPVDRNDVQREEKLQSQLQWLGQLIQRAPGQVVRERTVRRRWYVTLAAFAAAAMALVFVNDERHPNTPELAVVTARDGVKIEQVLGKVVATHADGRDEVLTAGMTLSSGDRVSTTAEAFASLGLEAGIRVDLATATTVAVVSKEEIELRVGRVDVNVPKLPGVARRLAVNTPDTKVLVLGTIFSVEVDGANFLPETRVGVTRGAVSVLHHGDESLVEAGQAWRSTKPRERQALLEEETSAPPPDAPQPVKAAEARPAVQTQRRRPKSEPASVGDTEGENEAPPSSLSRQNTIFERGLRARDQGDPERAAYWFEQLLSRYPMSPLAESAERERAAALARMRKE
jgi:hypothetical protein